jgi:hypothetical protein
MLFKQHDRCRGKEARESLLLDLPEWRLWAAPLESPGASGVGWTQGVCAGRKRAQRRDARRIALVSANDWARGNSEICKPRRPFYGS